jgi:MYXO-CTERM domain-containing protein
MNEQPKTRRPLKVMGMVAAGCVLIFAAVTAAEALPLTIPTFDHVPQPGIPVLLAIGVVTLLLLRRRRSIGR